MKCPSKAISFGRKKVGEIYTGRNHNVDLLSGELNINEPVSELVVNSLNEIIDRERGKYDFIIIDTAAGTHCPVISALEMCNLVFAVTEPSPLGAHDLRLILELLKKIKIESRVIVNRSDIGDLKLINSILDDPKTVYKVPYSKKLVKQYSNGIPIENENIRKIAESL